MKIDWKLTSNGNVEIEKKDVLVEYKNNSIYYKDEYGTHVINEDNKTYERINKEDVFKVNFKEELLIVTFDNTSLSYKINALYEEIDNIIKLTYSLGEEEKIIEVKRRDNL